MSVENVERALRPDVAAWVSTFRAQTDLRRRARVLGELARATTRTCLRYRVTGLAAEAGFFALLSLPPLVVGLVASAGYLGTRLGGDVLMHLRQRIADLAGTILTPDTVNAVITPTFDEVARGGRPDVVSLSFLLSLWSGSRALNVYVDTVSIMYGMGGHRGIVRTRALSFSLYAATLVIGAVLIPLALIGPDVLARVLDGWGGPPQLMAWIAHLYWPFVLVCSVFVVVGLYHVATPGRAPWRRDLPGAVLALALWLGASAVLRAVLERSVGGSSIYGPLTAPIMVLIWLYALAIAVLIGAALNAAASVRPSATLPSTPPRGIPSAA